jgi:hypothetical protein
LLLGETSGDQRANLFDEGKGDDGRATATAANLDGLLGRIQDPGLHGSNSNSFSEECQKRPHNCRTAISTELKIAAAHSLAQVYLLLTTHRNTITMAFCGTSVYKEPHD